MRVSQFILCPRSRPIYNIVDTKLNLAICAIRYLYRYSRALIIFEFKLETFTWYRR